MASAVILMPFYVLYLSTDTLGALSIYLAFAILIQILTTFSFDASIYVHFHEYRNDRVKLGKFISSAYILMLLIGLSIVIIMLLTGNWIFKEIFEKNRLVPFFPYGLISIVIGVLQAFFKVFTSLLQTRQEPQSYLRSNLLNFSLIAIFTIGGLSLYPNSLAGPIVGRLIAAIVSGGLSAGRVFSEFGFHFDRALIRSTFNFNFYSFIYQLQQWIINYFDRFLIAFYLPLSQVGVYDFMMKCLLAIEFVVNGLYSSFFPKVVSTVIDQPVKKATPEINRYYNGLTAVAMILSVLAILFFPIILEFFVKIFNKKQEYLLVVPFIPFAVLIYLFKSLRLYFTIPYGVLKYTKPLPAIYLVVSAIRIGGLVYAIPRFGIYGVIGITLLSFWGEIILVYIMGKMKFSYQFNLFKLLIAPVWLMTLIIALEISFGPAYPTLTHTGIVVICCIIILWAFRNELKQINPFKILSSK